jgi:hypothetical protein
VTSLILFSIPSLSFIKFNGSAPRLFANSNLSSTLSTTSSWGKLAITSFRRDLEFLLPRNISRADVSRANVLRENVLKGTYQEELLLRYSRI